ncbi:MAG: hypothetical protein WC552_01075 [Candidatus Omnitrophota bacterium]
MMIKKYLRHFNIILLGLALIALYGCGSGGGGGQESSLTSFLFSESSFNSGSSGDSFSSLGSATPELEGGAGEVGGPGEVGGAGGTADVIKTVDVELAQVHHPEPLSMVLMGSGLLAMAYYKTKKNHTLTK